MKEVDNVPDWLHAWVAKIVRIGNQAIMKAKEENRRYGIPDTIWLADRIFYIYEDGEVSNEFHPNWVWCRQAFRLICLS